jgi:hypothetical protein
VTVIDVLSRGRRSLVLWASLLCGTFVAAACNNGASLDSSEGPKDTLPADPPPDTTTTPRPDTTPPQPPDTIPTDTTPPPTPSADCGSTDGGGAPVHVGLAIGPNHIPPAKFGSTPFTGTQITATTDSGRTCLMSDLAAARRANLRVFISFTGSERHYRDPNGFSVQLWKQRVDRFRNLDLTPYIADGTILAHLIMDEPADPGNWSGKVVPLADIEEIAAYSKQVWPTMTTMIRSWPEYLKGYEFKHLDAIWFHYLDRWAPLDGYIAEHYTTARSLGLNIVGGLNVMNGGSSSSGIPGKHAGKNAMSADEIRAWGEKLLDQPGTCAFLFWEYNDAYLSRPDIKAAMQEITDKAKSYPTRDCGKH